MLTFIASGSGRIAGSAAPRKYILEEKEPPTSVSSTVLLAAGDGIATKIAGPPLRKSKRAPRGRAAKKEAKDEAKRVWALASSAEAEALVARYALCKPARV